MSKLSLSDIVRLLRAGYTKDEINELKAAEADPEPAEADTEPAEADPEPAEADPAGNEFVDEISKLTQQVKDLTESVQAFKRNGAEKETIDPDRTADDIIKNMIEKGVS